MKELLGSNVEVLGYYMFGIASDNLYFRRLNLTITGL